ncbi:MAG: glycosyltransferase family 2 protein [Candidatus Sulfotelmatobacter sp.]
MIPSLDIILVNRNSGHELAQCLSSIVQADTTALVLRRVCVVDDASTDNSAAGLDKIALPLELIRNLTHTGYGASCNRAAGGATADYILFLNTDSTLFADSLDKPIRYLEAPEHSGVGMVGIQLLDAEGIISRSCSVFPTPGLMISNALGFDRLFPRLFPSRQMKRWDHLETREVDQVIGAFLLLRNAVFERLGGYDERFFVYGEDLDLSLRMRQLGYRSVYLASAQAVHQGGGTFRKVRGESLFFALRSRIQYAFKHFGFLRGSIVAVVTLCLEPITRCLWAVSRQEVDELKATIEAYLRLWAELFCGRLSREIRRGQPHSAVRCHRKANPDHSRLREGAAGEMADPEGGS